MSWIEILAKLGATGAVAVAYVWAHYAIRHQVHLQADNPIIRRAARYQRMLPGHWVALALAIIVLAGVWA